MKATKAFIPLLSISKNKLWVVHPKRRSLSDDLFILRLFLSTLGNNLLFIVLHYSREIETLITTSPTLIYMLSAGSLNLMIFMLPVH